MAAEGGLRLADEGVTTIIRLSSFGWRRLRLVPDDADDFASDEQVHAKGQHQIVVRSLFGKLTLASPRLYTCACQGEEGRRSHSPLAELLPERTTPELHYLQAKWAALLPYGVTVGVLEEVLPMETNLGVFA